MLNSFQIEALIRKETGSLVKQEYIYIKHRSNFGVFCSKLMNIEEEKMVKVIELASNEVIQKVSDLYKEIWNSEDHSIKERIRHFRNIKLFT